MKTIKNLITILLISFIGCNNNNKTIQVEINRNIETVSILYLIAEIGLQTPSGSFSLEAKEYFFKYKEHKAVEMLNKIINNTRSWNSPLEIILHCTEVPNIKLVYELDDEFYKSLSENQNIEEGRNYINEFLTSFKDFYKIAKVDNFINMHQKHYNKALSDVKLNLPNKNFIETMEEYYGQEKLCYNLIPSPVLFPEIGLGLRISTPKGLIVNNVFGAFLDSNSSEGYSYGFDSHSKIRDLSVHEFGHSFVNPITELSENRELIAKYSYLFTPIQSYMSDQAYRTWWICVTEHIVRLGEIRIALALNDSLTAVKIRNDNIDKNFIYLPYLEKNILSYENNRKKYKSFEEYLPILLENTFSEIDTSKLEIR